MCKYKDIFKKKVRNWVRNGLRMKMLMHIICFEVFIIFHECVHKWGTHSPPNLIK
jgi:hypothetical protein